MSERSRFTRGARMTDTLSAYESRVWDHLKNRVPRASIIQIFDGFGRTPEENLSLAREHMKNSARERRINAEHDRRCEPRCICGAQKSDHLFGFFECLLPESLCRKFQSHHDRRRFP